MTRVNFLRHGETVCGARLCGSTDVALTPRGLEQMWRAVGSARWRVIVSSPLRRCAVFAGELAERLGCELILERRFRELHFGAWEGRSTAELMAEDPDGLARFWRDPWHNPPPGAESLGMLAARVRIACTDVRALAGPVLVVTHGGPMRLVRCRRDGRPPTEMVSIDVPHGTLW